LLGVYEESRLVPVMKAILSEYKTESGSLVGIPNSFPIYKFFDLQLFKYPAVETASTQTKPAFAG